MQDVDNDGEVMLEILLKELQTLLPLLKNKNLLA
jgi:hypothetical protein